MKTRESLISNSSSSSFVIVYSTGKKCKCCGRGDPDLSDMINDNNYSQNKVQAKGKEKVIKCLRATYGIMDEFEAIIKEIEKLPDDMEVIWCDISYHDTGLNDVVNKNDGVGKFKVLYRDE